MIHIPQTFLGSEQEKKEVYKPERETGNSKAGRVSYQNSLATQEVFYYTFLCTIYFLDLIKV